MKEPDHVAPIKINSHGQESADGEFTISAPYQTQPDTEIHHAHGGCALSIDQDGTMSVDLLDDHYSGQFAFDLPRPVLDRAFAFHATQLRRVELWREWAESD